MGDSDLQRRIQGFVEDEGLEAARQALERLREGMAEGEEGAKQLGDYLLLRVIGRGAMGVIHEAVQISVPGRRVALKELSRTGSAALRLKRFRREIEVIGRFDHPNIVPILSADLGGDVPYYAMKLLAGRSLEETLERTPGLGGDYARLARMLRDVALALEHAHARGVVHRDVNPRNVVIEPDGTPVLIDFGLARDVRSEDPLTLEGDAVGTADYMAPEQVSTDRGPVTAATDVYALGATLYRCLALRPPYRSDSLHSTFQRILGGLPRPPRRFRPDVPRDLEAICLKAMDVEPSRRYASAKAVADDLDALLELRPVSASAPGFVRHLRWTLRRHKRWTAAVVVNLVLLAGVWTYFDWWAPREVEARVLEQVDAMSERLDDLERRGREVFEARARLEAVPMGQRLERADEFVRHADELADLALDWERTYAEATLDVANARLDRDSQELRKAQAGLLERKLRRALEQSAPHLSPEIARLQERLEELDPEASRRSDLLDEHGSLEIRCRQEGTKLFLCDRLDSEEDGRWLFDEAHGKPLTPNERHSVPEGSYLLIARLEGHVDTRLPILVRRQAVQREGEIAIAVECHTANVIGEGWCFINGGRSILGEPVRGPLDFRELLTPVDSFFIMEKEVDEALVHSLLPEVWKESRGDPVPGRAAGSLNRDDAEALTRAFNAREAARGAQRPFFYRLPTPLEWERAGRGADGRLYPWGDRNDFAFSANYQNSHDGDHRFFDPATASNDCSPFGVRDLAGSRHEMCLPIGAIERIGRGKALVRGGSVLSHRPDQLTLLAEHEVQAAVEQPSTGLRLAKVILPPIPDLPHAAFQDDFLGGDDAGWKSGLQFGRGFEQARRVERRDGVLLLRGYAGHFSDRVQAWHGISVPPSSFRARATVHLTHASENVEKRGFTLAVVERPEWWKLEKGGGTGVGLSVGWDRSVACIVGSEKVRARLEKPTGDLNVELELEVRDGRVTCRVWPRGGPRPDEPFLDPLPLPPTILPRARTLLLEVDNLASLRVEVDRVSIEPLAGD